MVFSQLSVSEKDAFFSLLDEYFASRPDLLSNIAKSQAVDSAANAAHEAFKNPATRNAMMDKVKGGVNSAKMNWNSQREASPEPADEKVASGPGRVAAAAASLMSHPRFGGSPTPASTGPPKPPARKPSIKPAADDSTTKKYPVQRGDSTASSLSSTRTFGSNVDMTSAKGFYSSVRGSPKIQPLANPSSFLPPPSSGTPKKQFAPPPVRRIASDSSQTSTSPGPPPPPPPRRKEEPSGEWADVLYDFTGEPGDLEIRESQRVLVVKRDSDDWWTAELDGKQGLVPASYIKVL